MNLYYQAKAVIIVAIMVLIQVALRITTQVAPRPTTKVIEVGSKAEVNNFNYYNTFTNFMV